MNWKKKTLRISVWYVPLLKNVVMDTPKTNVIDIGLIKNYLDLLHFIGSLSFYHSIQMKLQKKTKDKAHKMNFLPYIKSFKNQFFVIV